MKGNKLILLIVIIFIFQLLVIGCSTKEDKVSDEAITEKEEIKEIDNKKEEERKAAEEEERKKQEQEQEELEKKEQEEVLKNNIVDVNSVVLESDYLNNINEPLEFEIDQNNAMIGDLEKDKVEININENTFDEKFVINISNPKSVPEINKDEGVLLGSPIAIEIDSENKRLNDEVIITLKLAENDLIDIKHGDDIWVAYFNGVNWDYILPSEVNLEEGYLKFGTYHFSWFSKVKPTKEERIKKFINTKSTADWAINNGAKGKDEVLEKLVNDIVKNKFGVVDKSFSQDIIEGLMSQNDYTKLLVSYNNNKNEKTNDAFNLDLSVMVGKQVFKSVEKFKVLESFKGSPLQNALGTAADKAGKINTGINVLKFASEGKYEDAAKEFSKELISSFPVGKFLQTGAVVIDRQINRWKSEEMDAAYKVFINGADSIVPFWGYQVEKGNFEQLWDQMSGIREKIYSDAIADYAKLHNLGTDAYGKPNVDMLGDTALDKIRSDAKANIKAEFIKRRDNEAEIDKINEINMELIKEFENANLFSNIRYGYDTDKMSLEDRMKELFEIRDRILKDVNKPLGIKRGSLGENITASHVAMLTQALKNSENGEEKYQELLIKLGYVKETTLKDIEGEWTNVTAFVKEAVLNPEIEKIIKNGASDNEDLEGCDEELDEIGDEVAKAITEFVKALNGSTLEANFTIVSISENEGSIKVNINFSDDFENADLEPFVCSYNNGKLFSEGEIDLEENGSLKYKVDLKFSKKGNEMISEGTIDMTSYAKGIEFIRFSFKIDGKREIK